MHKKILALLLFSLLAGACAWSPWITRDRASRLAETQFNNAWNTVIDGCGTSTDGLGVKEFRKAPFGAFVTVDYQCGLVAPNEPALHATVYISFFGIAFGYPA